jgi:hypothetical protein
MYPADDDNVTFVNPSAYTFVHHVIGGRGSDLRWPLSSAVADSTHYF